ncbi:MAG: thioredoxin family protein [Nitrospiraceae bacterium]|nr:MAG: thioredoxin family protein [Nitrospiraceae bacterium]
MTAKRKIEVFSAGCPVCERTIEEIRKASCPSCDITVLDMQDTEVAVRAKSLSIRSVPAVVIDGKLSACGCGCGVDIEELKKAGLGQPIR